MRRLAEGFFECLWCHVKIASHSDTAVSHPKLSFSQLTSKLDIQEHLKACVDSMYRHGVPLSNPLTTPTENTAEASKSGTEPPRALPQEQGRSDDPR